MWQNFVHGRSCDRYPEYRSTIVLDKMCFSFSTHCDLGCVTDSFVRDQNGLHHFRELHYGNILYYAPFASIQQHLSEWTRWRSVFTPLNENCRNLKSSSQFASRTVTRSRFFIWDTQSVLYIKVLVLSRHLFQVTIHIIDLLNPQRTEKRPISADAALMNPVARILALRYHFSLFSSYTR